MWGEDAVGGRCSVGRGCSVGRIEWIVRMWEGFWNLSMKVANEGV